MNLQQTTFCEHHSATQAIGACRACGRPLCAECLRAESRHRLACEARKAGADSSPRPPAERSKGVTAAGALNYALGVYYCFISYVLFFAFASAIREAGAFTSWEMVALGFEVLIAIGVIVWAFQSGTGLLNLLERARKRSITLVAFTFFFELLLLVELYVASAEPAKPDFAGLPMRLIPYVVFMLAWRAPYLIYLTRRGVKEQFGEQDLLHDGI